MNTATIMDMMFNTEMIVKDMNGGKEDMTEKKFDYRVIELKCHMGFDYMENDTFEEFYLKLMELCEEYNIHLSAITRRADVMLFEDDGDVE